jgi:hypothetical protein
MKHEFEIERAAIHFDPETRIVEIVYRGALDGETNARVYQWLEELYHEVGIDKIWGQIFDFRNVTEFLQDNLKTARRNSARLNMRTDVSQFPAALIVNDFYHEEILRGSMRVSTENIRKRIVWSRDEALEFIEEWHAEHAPNKD